MDILRLSIIAYPEYNLHVASQLLAVFSRSLPVLNDRDVLLEHVRQYRTDESQNALTKSHQGRLTHACGVESQDGTYEDGTWCSRVLNHHNCNCNLAAPSPSNAHLDSAMIERTSSEVQKEASRCN